MPQPNPSTYPKEQRWRFVQRSVSKRDLILFAKNVSKYHGSKIDDVLPGLLSFVRGGQTNLKDLWLDIWVNLLHQMGLGYTWNKGKYLYSTELCNYLAQTKDVDDYYLYWSLKFQFPFSFPKQKHYIDNNVAVQPIVLIFQFLLQLYSITKNMEQTYLSKNEITRFLMRSKTHNDIEIKCREILKYRNENYDYSQEELVNPGFIEAGNHFFARGKLFLQNVSLLKFSNNKILIQDDVHLQKVYAYLQFAQPPFIFRENSQDIRNSYFSTSFNDLNPEPQILSEEIGLFDKLIPEQRIIKMKEIVLPSKDKIDNPKDLKGYFTKSFALGRKFQATLRKDLLVLYKGQCCVCDLNIPSFLRTSHIVSVETDPSIAADRSNCLLLCVLHDVAFEQGVFGIDDSFKIKINKKFLDQLDHPLLKMELLSRNNQKIKLPIKLKPELQYLHRHRLLHDIDED